MDRFRHQLPAFSPVAPRHLAGALLRDPGPQLVEDLCAEYHADDVLLCGSGTQALQIALGEGARRTGRDTLGLPAFGCYDLASAAMGAGSHIRIYDIDPATLGPDLDSLRRVMREGAGTVVIAPLFGVPVAWDELSELARREGCLLIEDAAQGHGAEWHGRPLGAWGALSVISFGRGKGWTAGSGGALFSRGTRLSFQLESPPRGAAARAAVSGLAQWALGRPAVYAIPAGLPVLGLGRTVYREPRTPVGLTRFGRALLAATREDARAEAAQRRRNADRFESAASDAGLPVYAAPPGSTPGYIRYPVRLTGAARASAATAEARRLGIAAAYPAPLGELPALAGKLIDGQPAWPGAVTLVRELVTLPTHSLLSESDLRRLSRFLDKWRAEPAGGSVPD